MNQDTSNTIQELQAIVRGQVQGVGYRYFVVHKAASLDLRGYVRNESNGDVAVLAQGPRQALEALLTLLQQGPSAAHVTEVQTIWRRPTEHFRGFYVRY